MSDNVRDVAVRKRDALRRELAEVERFIVAYDTIVGGGKIPVPARGDRIFVEGQKETVLHHIKVVLEEKGGPLKAREIYERLVERGIQIDAKNPKAYVSTLCWRASDEIEKVPFEGYCLKGQRRALYPISHSSGAPRQTDMASAVPPPAADAAQSSEAA